MNKELVIVSAKWCANCGPLKKKLEDAGIQFHVIDAEESPQYCLDYGVRGLPTALFFEDGELVKSLVGNNPIKEYTW